MVKGGGGIQPDVYVDPEPVTRLRMALDASGTFTSFATSYILKHQIIASFQVSASDLEDFQVYASEREIQPSVGEWVKERDWVQSRLKQEIFNQALGVAQGDEEEAQRDPVVQAAIQKLLTERRPQGSLCLFYAPPQGIGAYRSAAAFRCNPARTACVITGSSDTKIINSTNFSKFRRTRSTLPKLKPMMVIEKTQPAAPKTSNDRNRG